MIERHFRSLQQKIQRLLCFQSRTSDFCRTLIKPLGFLFFLCTFYLKQMAPCPSILDLGMQFIQIISQAQQKDLQFYLRFSSQQKSLEFIIVFQHPKGSFYLDRAVHPVLDPFFTQDVFIGFLTLFQKVLRKVKPLVSFCFRAFFFIRAAAAVLTFIYGGVV